MNNILDKILGDDVRKVFITGGSGFIGSHVCDLLIEQGYLVTAFDNLSNGRREFVSQHLDNPNFRLIEADCLDLVKMKTAMEGHDLVWHLAANTDIIGRVTRGGNPLITQIA